MRRSAVAGPSMILCCELRLRRSPAKGSVQRGSGEGGPQVSLLCECHLPGRSGFGYGMQTLRIRQPGLYPSLFCYLYIFSKLSSWDISETQKSCSQSERESLITFVQLPTYLSSREGVGISLLGPQTVETLPDIHLI